jgi:hypothetical protein
VVASPTPEPPIARRLTRQQPEPPELPAGVRQLAEGYWLGPLIGPQDVSWLSALGVRVVLSAVEPSPDTLQALSLAGIEVVPVIMGARFRHADLILSVAQSHRPAEMYIHCRHGADRTGAIAAFLLVVRHGWQIADAFYSVLYPSPQDTAGLADVLAAHGILDTRAPDDPSVGYYSVSAAGGVGGLKARNERYGLLVETTLEAIVNARASP